LDQPTPAILPCALPVTQDQDAARPEVKRHFRKTKVVIGGHGINVEANLIQLRWLVAPQ
jgi:hypothetical protein